MYIYLECGYYIKLREFTIRQMKMLSVTSQEDGSMPVTSKDDIGPLEESEVVIYGNTLNYIFFFDLHKNIYEIGNLTMIVMVD